MRCPKFFNEYQNGGRQETNKPLRVFQLVGFWGDNLPGLIAWTLSGVIALMGFGWSTASAATNPLTREYPITIDPTALDPPTWWHVPGVTPLIWTKDPATYEAYRTTEIRTLKLKPGEYRFGTFTFDFAFRVTLDGVIDFSPSLSQCVDGRGTSTLTIRCSHTQPYKQEPDYSYDEGTP